jgi:hypothetical protein
MVKFDKPVNLNGAELLAELSAAGVKVSDFPRIDGNGDFWLDIANKDQSKAAPIIAAHNGTTIAPELSVEQKLASVGLNLNDLKLALGL